MTQTGRDLSISDYDVCSKFDLRKHKKKYIDYLEVMILEDGEVEYAVPSHQMKAEEICCKKLNLTRQQLIDKTKDHLFDYIEELLTLGNCVAVWNDFCLVGYEGINEAQARTLRRLKLNGIYRGSIPAPSSGTDFPLPFNTVCEG